MDRFREPGPERILRYCDACNGEIYPGYEVYEICGNVIHEDCLEAFAGRLKTIEEVVE